jgi:hypothetical protein
VHSNLIVFTAALIAVSLGAAILPDALPGEYFQILASRANLSWLLGLSSADGPIIEMFRPIGWNPAVGIPLLLHVLSRLGIEAGLALKGLLLLALTLNTIANQILFSEALRHRKIGFAWIVALATGTTLGMYWLFVVCLGTLSLWILWSAIALWLVPNQLSDSSRISFRRQSIIDGLAGLAIALTAPLFFIMALPVKLLVVLSERRMNAKTRNGVAPFEGRIFTVALSTCFALSTMLAWMPEAFWYGAAEPESSFLVQMATGLIFLIFVPALFVLFRRLDNSCLYHHLPITRLERLCLAMSCLVALAAIMILAPRSWLMFNVFSASSFVICFFVFCSGHHPKLNWLSGSFLALVGVAFTLLVLIGNQPSHWGYTLTRMQLAGDLQSLPAKTLRVEGLGWTERLAAPVGLGWASITDVLKAREISLRAPLALNPHLEHRTFEFVLRHAESENIGWIHVCDSVYIKALNADRFWQPVEPTDGECHFFSRLDTSGNLSITQLSRLSFEARDRLTWFSILPLSNGELDAPFLLETMDYFAWHWTADGQALSTGIGGVRRMPPLTPPKVTLALQLELAKVIWLAAAFGLLAFVLFITYVIKIWRPEILPTFLNLTWIASGAIAAALLWMMMVGLEKPSNEPSQTQKPLSQFHFSTVDSNLHPTVRPSLNVQKLIAQNPILLSRDGLELDRKLIRTKFKVAELMMAPYNSIYGAFHFACHSTGIPCEIDVEWSNGDGKSLLKETLLPSERFHLPASSDPEIFGRWQVLHLTISSKATIVFRRIDWDAGIQSRALWDLSSRYQRESLVKRGGALDTSQNAKFLLPAVTDDGCFDVVISTRSEGLNKSSARISAKDIRRLDQNFDFASLRIFPIGPVYMMERDPLVIELEAETSAEINREYLGVDAHVLLAKRHRSSCLQRTQL